MADASKDFVSVVEGEIREREVDPCGEGLGEEGEEGQVEAVCGKPEALQEEDGDGDVVDSGFACGAEVACEVEVGGCEEVGEVGREEEDEGIHGCGGLWWVVRV